MTLRKVQKYSNSFGVTIPADICTELGIDRNTQLAISLNNNVIEMRIARLVID